MKYSPEPTGANQGLWFAIRLGGPFKLGQSRNALRLDLSWYTHDPTGLNSNEICSTRILSSLPQNTSNLSYP